MQQWVRFHLIKHWYEKYERILMPATLVFGVLLDAFTFTNISIGTTFLLLGIYFVVSGGAIIYLSAYDAKRLPHKRVLGYIRLFIPLLLQITFGALLSGVFIFFFFSGTIFVSWPFILILVLLMVSNDVFRRYYLKPLVQISVYFFIVFSGLSIALPFLFNSLSVWIFVGSGIASLIFIWLYIYVLTRVAPELKKQSVNFLLSILAIFVFINGLYFLNIIPPIPLSIREATVSHGVVRNSGAYVLRVEDESVWDRIMPGQVFHKAPEESVSVYTAIFAPKNLNTKIIHDWQWYDEGKKEWVSKDKLSFTLTGGRSEGFRGYSTKTTVPNGRWRVYVKTDRGQVLGRVSFDVASPVGNIILKNVLK